jgi:hypothetical protein
MSIIIFKLCQNGKFFVARWALLLGQYKFKVYFRSGKKSGNADALSRLPLANNVLIKDSEEVDRYLASFTVEKDKDPQMNNHDKNVTALANLIGANCSHIELEAETQKHTDERYIKLYKEKRYLLLREIIGTKLMAPNCANVTYNAVKQQLIINGKNLVHPDQALDILYDCHHHPALGAHTGATSLITSFKQDYVTPALLKNASTIVEQCIECQHYKDHFRKEIAPMISIKLERPFQILSMYIAGPFIETTQRNKYILTICDNFSKYCVIIPMKNQEAVTVAKALVDRVIAYLGAPETILTDQGANFEGLIFRQLCELLHKKKFGLRPIGHRRMGSINVFTGH